MSIKQQYFGGISKIEVQQNDAENLGKLSNKWNNKNCTKANLMNYKKRKSDLILWHCPSCINELPFANTSKSNFISLYCSLPLSSVSCKPTVKPLGKKAKKLLNQTLGKKIKELLKTIKDLNHIFGQSEHSIS